MAGPREPRLGDEFRFRPANSDSGSKCPLPRRLLEFRFRRRRQRISRHIDRSALSILPLPPDSDGSGGSRGLHRNSWPSLGWVDRLELIAWFGLSAAAPPWRRFSAKSNFPGYAAGQLFVVAFAETDSLLRTRERKWPRN